VHQHVQVDGFEKCVIVNTFGQRVQTLGDQELSVGEVEPDADGDLLSQRRNDLTQFVIAPESCIPV
jgi:hypothetical protein